MIRCRPPSRVLVGPVERIGPRVVRVQVPSTGSEPLPLSAAALVYLGGRGDAHPLRPCAMPDPNVAREHICGLEAVIQPRGEGDDAWCLQSVQVQPDAEAWQRVSPYLA